MASGVDGLSSHLVGALSGELFSIQPTRDLIGLELQGALKNVAAVLLGVADGLGLSTHDKARVLARTAVEISEVVFACGGTIQTCISSAGIEDLIETAMGGQSRSFRAGHSLVMKRHMPRTVDQQPYAEGLESALGALHLLRRTEVSAPMLSFAGELVLGRSPARGLMDAWSAGNRIFGE